MLETHAKNELDYFSKHASNIFEYSSSFLSSFNLSHFWVSRYYFDGFYQDLATDTKWKEKMTQQGWYNNFVISFLDGFAYMNQKDFQSFLWSSELTISSPLLDQIKQDCAILSGFNCFVINDDYVENYGFGSQMNINQLSQIMNRINTNLYGFVADIKEKTKTLFIDHVDLKGTLNKPFACNQLSQAIHTYGIPKRAPRNGSYLTRQEIICLSLLKDNLSYKEIANRMRVSPRTVECFLYNPKKRLGLTSTNQLLYLFRNDAILSNLKVIRDSETIG